MAPVYRALDEIESIEPLLVLTGQHREQLQQALSLFDMPVAANFEVMSERQRLPLLAARILPEATKALKEIEPDYVLVQGDTLSTFVVAWTAFLDGIPLGHVEAGLRTHDLSEPFPEEANRRLTSVLTDLDFAPTQLAKEHLMREGTAEQKILITGQTGIDAVLLAVAMGPEPPSLPPGPYVSVTLHRRENWPHLGSLAEALAKVARQHPDFTFVYPMHLNPTVREAVRPVLRNVKNFVLLDPLEYGPMVALLSRSDLIVTDSGGLQEEGAALGVPVVVVRNVTERPEGVRAGVIKMAGIEPDHVYRMVDELVSDKMMRETMSKSINPYGDGRAGKRVAAAVAWRLGLGEKPMQWTGAA